MREQKINKPVHVAVILDGNRRWARKKGFKSWIGHQYGTKKVEEILKIALDLKIPYISFWGSSLDNLAKRSKTETSFLLEIFRKEFTKLAKDKDIYENGVKINVIGRWKEMFPEKVKKPIQLAIDKTKNHKNLFLNFFLAYSGDDEMMQAIKNIVNLSKNEKDLEITPQLIKDNLFTHDMPPVDYLIRTGGEPHLSCGFMMWDISDTRLYFSDKLWPDFTGEDFIKAIKEYKKTNRRFGK